jgi:hypothetical protein
MVDTVRHSRDSSSVIRVILISDIPKGKERAWRSVEDRPFADTGGSVLSVSGIGRAIIN